MATQLTIVQPQNLETFMLIWLDSLVNKSEDNIDTKILLRKTINRLVAFEDMDKCIEYIKDQDEERIVLIVSGRLGQQAVPALHHLAHLIAIYVYCGDKKRHEIWTKEYIKIKGVIDDLKELIIQIQIDQTKRNEYKIDEPIPISYYTKTKKQNLTMNNDDFISSQLLLDCLSRMKPQSNEREQLIRLCKDEYLANEIGLNMIRDFEEKYSPDRAIWWLTRESFVCRVLNKAFQVTNIDLLYYFNFFIRDVRKQLELNKSSSRIRTYRAQIMSSKELRLLKLSIGEIISIDIFLFTIPSRERAIQILQESNVCHDLKRVLIEIDADPSHLNMKPFGDVTSLNYFTDVEVTLFMVGTIFHPVDISEENDITVIQMETCCEEDPSVKTILDAINAQDYEGKPNLLSLGYILSKMKKFYYAEKCYNQLLKEMPDDHYAMVSCYQGFGTIAMEKQEYDVSLKWYQKALDADKAKLKPDDPIIASDYNTLADIHVKKGEYTQAIESYTRALNVWIAAFGTEHLKVAKCYNKIGITYETQEKYLDAIDYYKKTVIIYHKTRCVGYPEIAKLYNHIASIYASIDKNTQALKYFNAALKILTKIHPFGHPEVVRTMKNIAATHEASGNAKEALVQFETIASIHRQLLPLNHPDVAEITDKMQRIFAQLNKNV
ncbi:unnamed protein product [Rotaria magnacalcarata]|uniref:Uncharacterized protein n=3 Tax=Rotaria magnacalcarata TaxID=392030 RepID=A0A816AUJ2_9BILA|nr:unnamed protein product [Rotaria magnacalcarata]